MKPLTKQLLAAYICWVMLHLIFLVAGDNFFGDIDTDHYLGVVKNEFFPFEDEYGHYMRVFYSPHCRILGNTSRKRIFTPKRG